MNIILLGICSVSVDGKHFLSSAAFETLFLRMTEDGESKGERKISRVRHFRSQIVRLFNEYQPKEDKYIAFIQRISTWE